MFLFFIFHRIFPMEGRKENVPLSARILLTFTCQLHNFANLLDFAKLYESDFENFSTPQKQ